MALLFAPAAAGAGADAGAVEPERLSAAVLAPDGDAVARAVPARQAPAAPTRLAPVPVVAAAVLVLAGAFAAIGLPRTPAAAAPVAVRGLRTRRRGPPLLA